MAQGLKERLGGVGNWQCEVWLEAETNVCQLQFRTAREMPICLASAIICSAAGALNHFPRRSLPHFRSNFRKPSIPAAAKCSEGLVVLPKHG